MTTVEHLNKQSVYPWSNYGLKLSSGRPTTTVQYVTFIVQIAVLIVLNYLSVVLLGPLSYSGVSLFYFVYPFYIIFTIWWGLWGAIGAYIGGVVGAGLLVGVGVVPSLLSSFSVLFTALATFIFYRGFLSKHGIDPLMRDLTDGEISGYKTHRGQAWMWMILTNAVIFNLINTEIGINAEYVLGLIPPSAYWFWWAGWFLGQVISLIILMPIIVKGVSKVVERQGLVNIGWLS